MDIGFCYKNINCRQRELFSLNDSWKSPGEMTVPVLRSHESFCSVSLSVSLNVFELSSLAPRKSLYFCCRLKIDNVGVYTGCYKTHEA